MIRRFSVALTDRRPDGSVTNSVPDIATVPPEKRPATCDAASSISKASSPSGYEASVTKHAETTAAVTAAQRTTFM
jgi:hypothetical protein